jgi:cysteinyl-tRNA synthetase
VDSWREGYGKLSGRTVDDMIAGARVEVAPYKRNPMDFVLWKPSDEGQPGWESPWGRGRPGWHIECSAMAYELLGESFDIHGGGNDLMFPHHENEIAQSCCAHPDGEFAKVWLHNEMLQVEGKKMSKSLGNFFTVRDLLDQGIPGEVIRFVFLSTHYRKPMDWTAEKAREAESELFGWALQTTEMEPSKNVPDEIVEPLCNDLNTHGCITALRTLSKQGRYSDLKAGLGFLGFDLKADESSLKAFERLSISEENKPLIEDLIQIRAEARSKKDFDTADKIRDGLKEAGVSITDDPDGGITYKVESDFNPAKLQGLIEEDLWE